MCLVRFLKREQDPEELQIALVLQSLYYNVFFRKTASLLRYRIRVLSRTPVNERRGVIITPHFLQCRRIGVPVGHFA